MCPHSAPPAPFTPLWSRKFPECFSLFSPCLSSLSSSPLSCFICMCFNMCVGEGVCDSGTVKSDVWDAKGGVVPYVTSSPAPAARSSRPRLLLPPLSSWLLPLSLCGGVCCLPRFPFFLTFLPSSLMSNRSTGCSFKCSDLFSAVLQKPERLKVLWCFYQSLELVLSVVLKLCLKSQTPIVSTHSQDSAHR